MSSNQLHLKRKKERTKQTKNKKLESLLTFSFSSYFSQYHKPTFVFRRRQILAAVHAIVLWQRTDVVRVVGWDRPVGRERQWTRRWRRSESTFARTPARRLSPSARIRWSRVLFHTRDGLFQVEIKLPSAQKLPDNQKNRPKINACRRAKTTVNKGAANATIFPAEPFPAMRREGSLVAAFVAEEAFHKGTKIIHYIMCVIVSFMIYCNQGIMVIG